MISYHVAALSSAMCVFWNDCEDINDDCHQPGQNRGHAWEHRRTGWVSQIFSLNCRFVYQNWIQTVYKFGYCILHEHLDYLKVCAESMPSRPLLRARQKFKKGQNLSLQYFNWCWNVVYLIWSLNRASKGRVERTKRAGNRNIVLKSWKVKKGSSFILRMVFSSEARFSMLNSYCTLLSLWTEKVFASYSLNCTMITWGRDLDTVSRQYFVSSIDSHYWILQENLISLVNHSPCWPHLPPCEFYLFIIFHSPLKTCNMQKILSLNANSYIL